MYGKASSRHRPRGLLFYSSVFVYSRDLFSLFFLEEINSFSIQTSIWLFCSAWECWASFLPVRLDL